MSASAALLAAAFAAGTAEGLSVLSHLSNDGSDREESKGSEQRRGSTTSSSSSLSLLLPSVAYSVASLPLTVVGGSPGPAMIASISPFDERTATAAAAAAAEAVEDRMKNGKGPMHVSGSAATTTVERTYRPPRPAQPPPSSSPAAVVPDERSGPVRLGGRIVRSEESAAASVTSFEEAVPLISDHQRRRREGVRPLRRAPNLEPGPHAAAGEALPSAGDARDMTFDAVHASMRAPSSSVGEEGGPSASGGERLRRPRRQMWPDEGGEVSGAPHSEGGNGAAEQPSVGVSGVSQPMRERAEEMRAARKSSAVTPLGIEVAEEATTPREESPSVSTARIGAAAAANASDPAIAAAAAAAPKKTASVFVGKNGNATPGGLARYVATLDGRPLPTPGAEALRRFRIGLVGLAAVTAMIGYDALTLDKKKGDTSKSLKRSSAEGKSTSTAVAVERYLVSAQGKARQGTALRLVSARNPYVPESPSGNGQTCTLPVVCPAASSGNDDLTFDRDASSALSAHWQLGGGSADGRTGDWSDVPMTSRWMFRPGGRTATLLVEADVSANLHEYLSGGREVVTRGSGQGQLAPETVRLAARCLSVAARRNGLLSPLMSTPAASGEGETPDVVRVVVGSGPFKGSTKEEEEEVVYIDGVEEVASDLVRTLDEMHCSAVVARDGKGAGSEKAGLDRTERKDGSFVESKNVAANITSSSEETVAETTSAPSFSSDPLGTVGSIIRRAGAGTASAAVSTVDAVGTSVRWAGSTAAATVGAVGSSVRHGLGRLGGLVGGRQRKIVHLYADGAVADWIRPILSRRGWTIVWCGSSFDGTEDSSGRRRNKNDDDCFVLVACPTDDATLDVASSLLAARPDLVRSGRFVALVESESSEGTLRALAEGAEQLSPLPTGGEDEATTVGVVCARSVREKMLLRARDLLARGADVGVVRQQMKDEFSM